MGARGLTIVELMVTLTVILLITAAASTAYVKLLRGVKVQGKITESQMDAMCGLEMLRYDVEMAGYGLFRVLPPTEPDCAVQPPAFAYEEANDPDASAAASYNDASGVPRPFFFSGNTGQKGADDNASDVLVIKSMIATAQAEDSKWSFLNYDGTDLWIQHRESSALDFSDNDTLIAIDETGTLRRSCSGWKIAFKSNYFTKATANSSLLPLPATAGDSYVVYGVGSSTIRMPFNRVDYYLKRPNSNFPSRCYAGSYILYRASINQSDGHRNEQPLVDCVMDFQVAFGIDSNGDKVVDGWVSNLNLTAAEIRSKVREVRIFILYHEGQRDDNFSFAGTLNLGDAQTAANANFQTLSSTTLTGALSSFKPANDATGEKLHYRWKVEKLTIKPMNLE